MQGTRRDQVTKTDSENSPAYGGAGRDGMTHALGTCIANGPLHGWRRPVSLPLAVAIILALLLTCCPQDVARGPTPHRLACVGDGWTLGSGIEDQERQIYPAALRWRLGDGYQVRTFARPDAAVRPTHGATDAWHDLLAYAPDTVVFLAGQRDPGQPGQPLAALLAALRASASKARLLAVEPVLAQQVGAEQPSSARANDAHRARTPAPELLRVTLAATDLARDGTPNPHGADTLATAVAQAILGRPLDPTTTAVPSPEWRASAAGWGSGNWWDQHETIVALMRANPNLELIFLGDAATQSLTGTGNRLLAPDGGRAVDQVFGLTAAAGLGIAGDRTQHVLFRIRHGELSAVRPQVIVLQIGIENVLAGDSADAVARGIALIVAELRARTPRARIVVCGPFPAGATAAHPARATVAAIHRALARLDDGQFVFHRDLGALFVGADGRANTNLAPDAVHLTEAGRAAWVSALQPLLQRWL